MLNIHVPIWNEIQAAIMAVSNASLVLKDAHVKSWGPHAGHKIGSSGSYILYLACLSVKLKPRGGPATMAAVTWIGEGGRVGQ